MNQIYREMVGNHQTPDTQWDERYIYLHLACKYTSPMDPMGVVFGVDFCCSTFPRKITRMKDDIS